MLNIDRVNFILCPAKHVNSFLTHPVCNKNDRNVIQDYTSKDVCSDGMTEYLESSIKFHEAFDRKITTEFSF